MKQGFVLAGLLLAWLPCAAQQPPVAVPLPPVIPAPVGKAYPGVITVAVDATDIDRRVFQVQETLPVAAGALTLLFPQWIPGDHGPSGPLDKLAGLVITAAGKRLDWVRDTVDVYAFHVNVPSGVGSLALQFQYVSPVAAAEGRVQMTDAMLSLEWNELVLYPAGFYARDIMVAPSVKLPAGWGYGTALEPDWAVRSEVGRFKAVPLNTLVDSPLIAGRYFERLDLDPHAKVPVHLDVVADRAGLLAVPAPALAAHRALVQQATRLFGSHHYDHYDFLLSLSDRMGGIGLEHHRSSEDGTSPKYFTDWASAVAGRDLLAHEYTHSWNGKFRRPADLWTPNFNVPMQDSLLWVYEGQTQYWGYVLAARAGLMPRQDVLDALAFIAATYDHRVGRSWRDLEDTTNDPVIAGRRPIPWTSWQRSEDYYNEGLLNWLDIDTRLRQLSGGTHSLDDFAHGFFGIDDGSYVTVTYGFDDVVHALGAVQPYGWAGLLHERLTGHAAGAPLDGITRGGYRLTYTPTAPPYFISSEARRKANDLSFSLGLVAGQDGVLSDVLWDGPAFKAGLNVGDLIVAVDGTTYSAADAANLKTAVTEAVAGKAPISLLIKRQDEFRTVAIAYHGGLRYPHLERAGAGAASLDAILAPRS